MAGKRVGMSPGHILYYYRSNQALLLETLLERGSAPRAQFHGTPVPSDSSRAPALVHRYLPATGPGQPEWLLWLQVWALGGEDPEVAAVTDGLNARWEAMLAGLIRFGVGRGEFQASAAPGFAGEYLALLDGLSLHVLHDTPALDRERAVEIAWRIAADELGVGSRSSLS
ncbi:MAG: TetR family transcriptional regulator C-terminal domain-containing protein [Actinobacteria bacterium]|nr:TetR family transcriptional regulator C-terminal domain-containing protein [Actinomycetota bacterium]